MSEVTLGTVAIPASAEHRPPPLAAGVGPLGWARVNLFNSILSSVVTVVLGVMILKWAYAFIDWGVVHAIWTVPQTATGPDTSICRDAKGVGACWAVIGEKYRFILFGRFPYRGAVASGDRHRAVHRPLHRLRHPCVLEALADPGVGRHADNHRHPDVGRHASA